MTDLDRLILDIKKAEEAKFRLEQICYQHGLSFAQYEILRIIRKRGEAVPTMTLRREMTSPVASIQHTIPKLELKKLVNVFTDPHDQRYRLVDLTKKGRALLEDVEEDLTAVEA